MPKEYQFRLAAEKHLANTAAVQFSEYAGCAGMWILVHSGKRVLVRPGNGTGTISNACLCNENPTLGG